MQRLTEHVTADRASLELAEGLSSTHDLAVLDHCIYLHRSPGLEVLQCH